MKQNKVFNQKITELKLILTKYLRTVTPIKNNLSANQLEEARAFKTLYKILSGNSSAETEPDISKPASVDAVTQWRKGGLSSLKKVKTVYALANIDPIQFNESIKKELFMRGNGLNIKLDGYMP